MMSGHQNDADADDYDDRVTSVSIARRMFIKTT
jgi:hypothetical protein